MKKAKKKETSAAAANSRELLLDAAREVFSDKGYEGASTRDIAKAAGVNISLISYHFQGKEGLLRACLEESSQAGLETVERVLKKPTNAEEFKTRFQIFIEEFIQIHIKNRHTSCIVMREMDRGFNNPVVMELFKHKFSVVFGKLVEFLTYAQKQKFIDSSINVEITASMLMGCISHMIRTDNIRKLVLGKPGLLEAGQIDKTIAQMAKHMLHGILDKED